MHRPACRSIGIGRSRCRIVKTGKLPSADHVPSCTVGHTIALWPRHPIPSPPPMPPLPGWGIYSSIDECMGAGEVVINADPVYPDPTYPTPTCPSTAPTAVSIEGGMRHAAIASNHKLAHISSNSSCPWSRLPQDGRTDCPFLASGLKRWNDPATWGGTVPSPGTSITLPANSKVLLSGCMISATATYTQVIIPATSEVSMGMTTEPCASWQGWDPVAGRRGTCRVALQMARATLAPFLPVHILWSQLPCRPAPLAAHPG